MKEHRHLLKEEGRHRVSEYFIMVTAENQKQVIQSLSSIVLYIGAVRGSLFCVVIIQHMLASGASSHFDSRKHHMVSLT